MEWQLPHAERTYLRELARKQAKYAAPSRLPDARLTGITAREPWRADRPL